MVLLLMFVTAVAAQPTVDHSRWDMLLRRYVSSDGIVDYRTLKERDHSALDGYLSSLAAADPTPLSKDERLAFWINAYNACVFKGVLDHYPMKSVKDVKGFFDKIRYQIAGTPLTLNDIEARGRALGDWRIHFAVVCASSSCPYLRNEAYVPGRLDAQLTDQLKRFLADSARGLRVEADTLWISKIFKWYAKDFIPSGSITAQMLLPLLTPYLDPARAQALQPQRLTVNFMDYDWSLNDTAQAVAK